MEGKRPVAATVTSEVNIAAAKEAGYRVTLYAVVRVTVDVASASSQLDAIAKAESSTDLHDAIRGGEYAEEVVGILVDENGDDEYRKSTTYLPSQDVESGWAPDTPRKPRQNDLPAATLSRCGRQQALVAMLAEVAVPGGIGEHEFSRPGGWLERAQKVLKGSPVEMDLLKQLGEARHANRRLLDNVGQLLSAYADVDELLDQVVASMPEGLTDAETATQHASNETRDRVQQEYLQADDDRSSEARSESEVACSCSCT